MWTTEDEVQFVRALGTHSEVVKEKLAKGTLSKIDLLKRYRAGMRLREDWGDIYPAVVLEEVDRLIEQRKQLNRAWVA